VLFDDPAAWDGLAARIHNGLLQVTCLRNGKRVTVESAFTDTASWHHLAVVKDGDAFTVYLDGAAVGSVPNLDTASASGSDAGAGDAFDGRIDEVRVYRRALAATEIADMQTVVSLTAADTWRGYHFGSTANSGAGADTNDADGDSMSNEQEFFAGTDPNAPGSVLEITSISITPPGEVSLEWTTNQDGTTPFRQYRVVYSDGPLSPDPGWSELWGDIDASGLGTNRIDDDISGVASGLRFYRVEMEAP
jgi:hypothetical protein